MGEPLPPDVLLDDNDETFTLLLSRKPSPFDEAIEGHDEAGANFELHEDLGRRLQRLADRLLSEIQGAELSTPTSRSVEAHWTSLLDAAKTELGFNVVAVAVAPREGETTPNARGTSPPASSSSPPPATSASDLAALGTPEGAAHLDAVSALLGCSKDDAARYTLGALRRSASSMLPGPTPAPAPVGPSASALVGTRALLETVSEGAGDSGDPDREGGCDRWIAEKVVPVLQKLDASYQHVSGTSTGREGVAPGTPRQLQEQHANRGLFRWLLALSTLPHATWNRDQFEPARKLRGLVPHPLQERPATLGPWAGGSNPDGSFDSWRHAVVNQHLAFQGRQKLEALEALVVLLYARLEGGVTRADSALLLLAMNSCHEFYGTSTMPAPMAPYAMRLRCLASLACVEAMGLWRMVTPTKESTPRQDSAYWAIRHPLLDGVDDTESAEIDSLLSFLEGLGSRCASRRQLLPEEDVAAEGVAIFALGLLFTGAYEALLASEKYGSNTEAYWQGFQRAGATLSEVANDSCDAFNSLYTVLHHLVEEPRGPRTVKSIASLHSPPFEVSEFCDEVPTIAAVPATSERELSAASLVYANIGRELVVGIIVAFEDSFFAKDHSSAANNFDMLSTLAAGVYRNSPSLCIPFWEEWNTHSLTRAGPSPRRIASPNPLCRFLDSTYHLATTGLSSSIHQRLKTSDEVLLLCAPVLTLCSSLVYDAHSTDVAIEDVLPPTLLRNVLEAVASRHWNVTLDRFLGVLRSILALAETGQSPASLQALRRAFEPVGGQATSQPSGPRLLASVAAAFADECRVVSLVYKLLALLVNDAPVTWLMDVMSSLYGTWGAPARDHLTPISDDASASSRVILFHAFVKRIPDVAFCDSYSNEAKVDFIALLERGVTSCVASLPGTLATLAHHGIDADSRELSHSVIRSVLCCATDALEAVHRSASGASPAVISAAEAMRASLVSSLATSGGLGDAIWYYACYPVTLLLAECLANYLRDLRVSGVTDTSGEQSRGFSEPTMRLLAGGASQQATLEAAMAFLKNVAALQELDFDFDGISTKGWLSHEGVAVSFEVSLAALRLLNAWARSVEDIVRKENSDLTLLALSCHRSLLSNAVVPPAYRRVPNFLPAWNASGLNYLTLLLQMLAVAPGRLPVTVSTEAFDLLFLTLRHAHRLSEFDPREMSIIRNCCDSKVLSKLVEDAASSAFILSEADGINPLECTELSLALRCFRIVSLCMKVAPVSAYCLLGGEPFGIVVNMCQVVFGTIDELRQDEAGFSDKVLLNRMRNACGCLSVILPLWDYARNCSAGRDSESVTNAIDEISHILSELAGLLFSSSKLWSKENPVASSMTGQRLLYCFLSTSLELLAVETKWVVENVPKVDPDHPILLALQTGLDQRLSKFSGVAFRYLSLPSMDLYLDVFMDLDDRNRHALPFASGELFERDVFDECHGYDVLPATDPSGALRGVSIARSLLDSEFRRSQTWTSFAEATARLLTRWRLELPNHPLLLSMPSEKFSLQVSTMILSALHENLIRLEGFQAAERLSSFAKIVISVSSSSSRLLLCFSTTDSFSADDVSAEQFVRFISLCLNRIVHLFRRESGPVCLIIQEILLSAAPLLTLDRNLRPINGISLESKVSLASTCCLVLRLLAETEQSRIQEYRSCFCACLVVLTELVASSGRQFDRDYVSALFDTFTQQGILAMILSQAAFVSTGDTGSPDTAPMTATLRFCKAISLLGEPKFVDLVLGYTHSILARTGVTFASSQSSENVLPRGYGQGSDSFHELWTEGLELLSTLIVASSSAAVSTRHRVASISFTFLNCHRELVLSCLQLCLVPTSDGSTARSFTLRLLREAALILSIASELCSQDLVGAFQVECPAFYSAVVPCCCRLLAELGSFLGTAAASRELFKLLSDFENAGELSENQFNSLSPAHRLLASTGFPNAKHEALRLSTFVSSAVEAISLDEKASQSNFSDPWTQPRQASSSDPRSLSSLESSCRAAVTSNFAFQAERRAAEVLFFAARLLRFTHPASTSFVAFSEREARALDSMPLVKVGSVISFRSGSLAERGDGVVRYGEVIQCDTVRRTWRVRLMGGGSSSSSSNGSSPSAESGGAVGSESLVSDFQLAGIEDASKRRCMLSFGPAPESSGDVESAMRTPSVGHLILSLRWCQERYAEMKASSRGGEPAPDMAVVLRLAEVSTVLLCTETSLHRLTGSHSLASTKHRASNVVAIQLMDLFADSDDVAQPTQPDGRSSAPCPYPRRCIGGLKDLLVPSIWRRAREQLHPELVRAREEMEGQSDGSVSGSGGGSGRRRHFATHGQGNESPRFGAIRRSDHRSPFRGIGM